ncbi:MFS transporter [Corynebacterium sp. 153RC1]|uniref:MFS transporter n=1 Tax=unclassified Corynebacterium TaxID=2624378 RepID=UPI00211CAC3D|nr:MULTISPECIES: MFS transporter [unclassified Corynebacterium]MCQ9371539.1 MFS transporter [Corynebacterium sp. 35RC1]MCQ9353051.1 MFS transporter [Corynebacterium sp. 209RC1]MCQ9355255.1 MFS transporter [Corynebacterium sp. 1222RC1]MCQ9357571.1 MFS transporter [Corynebacterium sp. 122RC1]MCQ9359148.1 MFS transporter [Corynebacterium sp. 142RC1]
MSITQSQSLNTTAHNNRWLFLGVLSAALFLIGADNSILYTALPVLREQLHTSEVQALWIINAYPLVLASLLLGTGTLGDKIGHRRMFEVGVVIFGLSSLFAALAPSATWLIVARGLLGFGAATMMPATLALIRTTFTDVRERNTAIGIWGSVATIGAALGPVLGGFLLEHFYWGSVFLINVPIALAAVIATQWLAPPNLANPQRHWDLTSSLLAMVTLTGTVLLIKQFASTHIDWAHVGLSAAAMLLGAVAFQWRQRLLSDPLLTWDIFRNRLFVGGVLAAAMSMFVLAGTEMITTQHFQLAEGFSPLQAGLVTAAMALCAFPTSILGGANLHRWGFQSLIAGGFAFMAVGSAVAAYALTQGMFPLLIGGLMLSGAGAGLVMSVTSTAIIGSAPKHRAGMAASVEEVSFEFGTLISVAALGSLFPYFYALRAPAQYADAMVPQAHQAISTSYLYILLIVLVVSALSAALTAYAFRGNPKETAYAHE